MGRKKILISNDDGINAKGILELIEIGKEFGDVIVVAPNGPRSAMSMALTVETPVRLTIHENKPEFQSYSCTGTPVDCIKIAFDKLLDKEPDLILSGINHGPILYKYSLFRNYGAVIEGCILEIP